ncbi:MAG: TonB-dependent receptor [Gammaproteobacteria bacterium]|jgi:outer membrane receptor protein involved in Fe transport|nr:TonB-dependent receptor [Chromatiales bacterium]MCP4926400.1 TonB-dependent receptor [Gammaproteobacteria bacterium]MDP7297458.1 TonB-dependent receptor [Gammaproteobacteria bacterium]MDP7418361.1 TonB-dependent receptor [Gammaproteobacteria bacterium]MDP7659595.1 TonB-dependent receptor [Gammaproteobacteria bacterium]
MLFHSYPSKSGVLIVTLILVAITIPHTLAGKPADDEMVVTATKTDTPLLELTGNTARLSAQRIRITNHQHIHQLGTQVAGTWLTRGNGQETLPAIRSPVLTGPGACGAFLILENSIPSRPTGFCNINELFEIPAEISRSIEIIRGPSNALYGSNGLHGTMNILLPEPGGSPGWNASAGIGPDEYYRGKLGWGGNIGSNSLTFGLLADHYNGFRADSGYRQQKGFVRLNQPLSNSNLGWTLSLQNLAQVTAGFITGEGAYKDSLLRVSNENPGAFRDADSQRLSLHWTPDDQHPWSGTDVRVYLRRSEMRFLMHFLPGQPLEENGQLSGGMIWTHQRPWGNARVTWGLDLEYMDGFIKQFQDQPTTSPPFLAGKLPQGWHYNFDVTSSMSAPYAQLEIPLATSWQLLAGLRLEYLRYDYTNNLPDGNTRDDGTPCPDSCRYNRPADRTDDFFNLAPNIGLTYRLNPQTAAFATLSRGFRAPQATELYRLQEQQDVADLDTTTLDSLELGMHRQTESYTLEAVTFAMRKRHYIFQDTNRNNISNGKSRHIGIELQAQARNAATGLYAGVAGTWARHSYDFSTAARGEIIVSGNDVDTAPRKLGSLHIGWEHGKSRIELAGIHQGSYWLDAANEHKYSGHNLLHLRAQWRMAEDWLITGRVNNITDKLYADRADFAFGNYRYFPGREREFFIEISYRQ